MSLTIPGQHLAAMPHVPLHLAIAKVTAIVDAIVDPGPVLYGLVLTTLIFTGIVLPAIWSRSPARRKAASEVLDRILRFLRPRT